MIRSSTPILLLLILFHLGTISVSCADDVDFENDLIPVFTKNGCNAGACHGAAIGRGGFKLSLYGSDPDADFIAITRQLEGRRINPALPSESLLLLKPSEQIEHGGGAVFDVDSESSQLIHQWIQAGSPRRLDGESSNFTKVQIIPNHRVMAATGESVSLQAIAHYDDGSKRDVTAWTIFAPEDKALVSIKDATCTVHRRGRHIVVARYRSEVVPVELIVPLREDPVTLDPKQRSNYIDDYVIEKLRVLRLPASGNLQDTALLRRMTLDLTGRLPSPKAVKAVLEAPLDREETIQELMQSDAFVDYWTLQLAKMLRLRPQRTDNNGALVYFRWLGDQLRDGESFQSLARELLLATGDTHQVGPANFYLTGSTAREQAEFVSEFFMGTRLRCANCHNHPLDRWTQDDYHGLAAIFARVETGRVIRPKPSGKVIHPKTLEPARPRLPGGEYLSATGGGIDELARWLTEDDNPFFARAIVNRLWKHMMGRGLVEPVDDFRATNPATHPELLDRLAEDFVQSGYDLRHTLATIAASATYRRRSVAGENQIDNRFYSHGVARPLEAEVLADAISDVLGVPSRYGNQPIGTRAISLVDPKTPSESLDVLGRCDRIGTCESSTKRSGGLAQMLHLLNGELINARVSDPKSRLGRMLQSGVAPREIVSRFYQVALSRSPTSTEQSHWNRILDRAEDSRQRRQVLEDFVWALVTCNEFVTNH